MKHLFNRGCLLLLGSGLLSGCIDAYLPDVPATTQSYLVVDGFINSKGSTIIKLSRSLGVAASNAVPPETKATVYIQDDAGLRYALAESPAGTYTSAALALSPARQYQLRISTTKGRSYASDLVPVKTTPPIDTLTWRIEGDGVQVNVNTHDATNNSRYYRWDYSETWQFTSAFYSAFEYVKASSSVQPRTTSIYTCWRTEPSTTIKQTTTAQLNQDIVNAYPVVQLPFNEKLRIKYSVLVQQHAQTAAEYSYWETLSKNTQDLGTLNDPLPTQLTGNIHCLSDASEPVLGYVSAHSVTQKRLFIDYNDLPRPRPIIVDPYYERCAVDTVYVRDAAEIFKLGAYTPYAAWYGSRQNIIAYFSSSTECVDCRLRGTNVKPSFWP